MWQIVSKRGKEYLSGHYSDSKVTNLGSNKLFYRRIIYVREVCSGLKKKMFEDLVFFRVWKLKHSINSYLFFLLRTTIPQFLTGVFAWDKPPPVRNTE